MAARLLTKQYVKNGTCQKSTAMPNKFIPSEEYIPEGARLTANALFAGDMPDEAHELLDAAVEWSSTHKYYDRLIGGVALKGATDEA